MDNFIKDIRYGLGRLWRRPGFTVIAVITLALGIGANSAIFSVVNSVILRPLPFRDSDRLMVIWGNIHAEGLNELELSGPEFIDLRTQAKALEQIAGYETRGFNLSGVDQPERLRGAVVSANLFSTLAIDAAVGRTLCDQEHTSGNDQVVLLSDSLWRRQYGGNKAILNQTITLDGQRFTVVGIMPRGFHFPDKDTEIWRPRALSADVLAEDKSRSARSVEI